jgi:transposase
LLANFKGRLIHDGFVPYWDYGSDHGLCNAHHLRELVFCSEEEHQLWADRLKSLLLRMHAYRQKHGHVPTFLAKRWIRRYRDILARARAPLRSKARALRRRLQIHEPYVLAFLNDPSVPFTNNQAEQDLRMMKVQQKISRGFRTFIGATHFAKIRSYLSTMRKQGRSLWDALTAALQARPFLPATA